MSKKMIYIFISLVLIGGVAFFLNGRNERISGNIQESTSKEDIKGDFKSEVNMKITSQAFENNGDMPKKYTCDGKNVNPPFSIFDVPENVESLVLIADDPDAPNGTWIHWTVWDIDPRTTEIKENSVPSSGTEGVTSFGTKGYGGPCPPSGTHHYSFRIYALDKKLGLSSDSDSYRVEEEMVGHILAECELIGLYSHGHDH